MGGAAVVLASALVWYFPRGADPSAAPGGGAASVQPPALANASTPRSAGPEAPAADTPPLGAVPVVDAAPRPAPSVEPRWMMAIGRRAEPIRSVAYLWRDGFAPPKLAPDEPHETN
jgi:hypothetical protein